ncbi:Protein-L-isoaspartate O-methyltransferase [uncultured archaeon]|nr:Protein-L-isoaspartate O-methyltransferase [uncultured archaeon]
MSWDDTLNSLIHAGILKSKPIIAALKSLPRENFLSEEMKQFANEDRPLPIGYGQTISAPHMYAYMLEAAQVRPGDKILEIGTGSGYGAALLSVLAGKKGKAISIESEPRLVDFARANLARVNLQAEIVEGDGYEGYEKEAPYDKIVVTAACEEVPPALIEQLKTGGRLLIPVGKYFQDMLLIEKTKEGLKTTPLLSVVFVPLVRKTIRKKD